MSDSWNVPKRSNNCSISILTERINAIFPLHHNIFFLAFVISLVLFRTLLNRQLWMNPLSDIMGGWGIWETVNGERQLTTECIENVIMMVPFSSVVMWTFGEKMGSGWKKILWCSGKIA